MSLYQIVLYLPKQSQWVKRVDEVIGRLSEAGLIQKWLNDGVEKTAKESIR